MVLLENVTVGQEVEVNFGNGIYSGKVKYKGGVQGKVGEWVGVALNEPVGDNRGCLNGRTYFGCKNNHGVFVDASRIRYRPMIRCVYDKYIKACDTSEFEPTLFKDNERPKSSLLVQPRLIDFPPVPKEWVRKSYNKTSLVSGNIPSAAMLDPKLSKKYFNRNPDPIYRADSAFEFCSRPTVPNYYMPHELQKYHLKHGWGNTKLIRHSSARDYRDVVKSRQWNDVTL